MDLVLDGLLVKVALEEQAERFGEMVGTMNMIVEMGLELDRETRRMLDVCHKNVVGEKRKAWSFISVLEDKIDGSLELKVEKAKEIRVKIETEIKEHCQEVLTLLNDKLMITASNDEARVFYLNMQANYMCYIAEVTKGDTRIGAIKATQKAYEDAFEVCRNAFKPAHPICLQLSLSHSVFVHDVVKSKSEACKMAKKALNEARSSLGSLNEETYQDATILMKRIYDNLGMWVPTQGFYSVLEFLTIILMSFAVLLNISSRFSENLPNPENIEIMGSFILLWFGNFIAEKIEEEIHDETDGLARLLTDFSLFLTSLIFMWSYFEHYLAPMSGHSISMYMFYGVQSVLMVSLYRMVYLVFDVIIPMPIRYCREWFNRTFRYRVFIY